MKIVIIEDEKYTAKDLQRTILSINPDVQILSILESVVDGIAFFQKDVDVDLIFSDIQLGDGLSFDIYEAIDVEIPIIYCTAYDEYALTAFKNLGIDYILKPFNKDAVKAAMDKFILLKKNKKDHFPNHLELLKLLKQEQSSTNKSLLVRKGDKITPIPIDDIAIFFIEHEAVMGYTFSGKKHILPQTLNTLESKLSPKFFRTSRQHLVNRTAVKEAAHYFNRKLKVSLSIPFKEDVLVGKLKATAFLDWLANN